MARASRKFTFCPIVSKFDGFRLAPHALPHLSASLNHSSDILLIELLTCRVIAVVLAEVKVT